MTRPKIWLLLDSRGVGGIESHCLELSRALASKANVTIKLLSHHGPHPVFPEGEAESLNGDLVGQYWLERPDVIHTHGYKATILARLLLRPLGARICSTYHAGEKLEGRLKWYESINVLTAKLSHHNFAVSEEISERIVGRCEVLANFVMPKDLALSGMQVAFVGRIAHEKGADRLADIGRQLGAPIHVYGEGDQAIDISNLILEGAKPSMEPYWQDIAVLVMPSRYEGLPMAALEALARGIPVVASDVGGLHTLITHRAHGSLIKQYHPERFARAIDKLLRRNFVDRLICGRQSQEHIGRAFSPEQSLRPLLAGYAIDEQAASEVTP